MKKTHICFFLSAVSILAFGPLGCSKSSGTTTPPPPAITVSVSPSTASVAQSGTQKFTATVANDSANGGVTWSATGGTFSETQTASGTATTWTAPATAGKVTITATSVTDTSISSTATVTVTPPLSVSLAPTGAQIAESETQNFTAMVANDSANGGVTWSATAGTFSATQTASGTATTWTPPATTGNVTITAASVTDPSTTATATVTVIATESVAQCIFQTTDTNGICGPYNYAPVTGSNGSNVNVQMDFWNSAAAPAGSTQTMYITNPGNWYVQANFPLANTAVETYPDSDAIYSATNPTVNSYTYIYSSYAENMNATTNTSAEAAYDIWLNNYGNEVMIWTDISNRSLAGCTSLATKVTFGGSNGVPVNVWDLCQYGSSELVWSLDQPSLGTGTGTVYGLSSGSVDIYAMLTYLISNNYLASSTYLTQIEYGFEICSTGGTNEEFDLTGWSITSSQ